MSDPVQREWRFYLDDMVSFAEKVIAYTQTLDQDSFVSSGLKSPGIGSRAAPANGFCKWLRNWLVGNR